jgi:hypothetical protein
MEEKKVLLLRTCKNDFEKIVKEWVKFRYLEVKKYWESRVLEKNWDYKYFDLIKLQNWYNSNSPIAIIEFVWNNWIVEKEWINYFEIELGELKEVINYEG